MVGTLCWLVLLDNLLRRMGGAGVEEWWWLASGKMEVTWVSGILSRACQLRFWSRFVRKDLSGFRRRYAGRRRDRISVENQAIA